MQAGLLAEQYGLYEIVLNGRAEGNPFVDVHICAQFQYRHRTVQADGFYDGDGIYRIRFMPDTIGEWTFTTSSNAEEMDALTGRFECKSAMSWNHGPVQIHNKYHFAYADGTAYIPIGTTCYAWGHQGEELEAQTLATLEKAPFNKMRMLVFPKAMGELCDYEPASYPFERLQEDGGKQWDFTRFNPSYFRHLENRIGELMKLGIEADLILFHPYDRWGFAMMDRASDERYLRYIIARLAAFRNIWWSLANEYDLMSAEIQAKFNPNGMNGQAKANCKTMADWDRYFRIVLESDPYQHLRSIHNCFDFYDYGKPWVTHCSIQSRDLWSMSKWREQYGKPVVNEECAYEGNINYAWGNITGEELVKRFWEGMVQGCYVGHSETYTHPDSIIWWSRGGRLYGDSPDRIGFLRKIAEDGPSGGIHPVKWEWDDLAAGVEGEYYLVYYGFNRPSFRDLKLPEDARFTIEIIDTWNMTINRLPGTYGGKCRIELPGKIYQAIRIRKVERNDEIAI